MVCIMIHIYIHIIVCLYIRRYGNLPLPPPSRIRSMLHVFCVFYFVYTVLIISLAFLILLILYERTHVLVFVFVFEGKSEPAQNARSQQNWIVSTAVCCGMILYGMILWHDVAPLTPTPTGTPFPSPPHADPRIGPPAGPPHHDQHPQLGDFGVRDRGCLGTGHGLAHRHSDGERGRLAAGIGVRRRR